jgi:general secretion pathway protein B
MSYILDALKRSEQERERAEVPMQTAVAMGAAPAEPRRSWPTPVAALVVAVNLAVLGWLGWQRLDVEQPVPAIAQPAPAAQPAGSLAHLAGSVSNAPMLASPAPPLSASPSTAVVRPAVAPQASPAASSAEVPLLAQLPEAFRRSVPSLAVNVHVYAEQPASRFVLVDMKRFGEDSELPNGMRIEQITPRGLVLNYQGQRFQLVVR